MVIGLETVENDGLIHTAKISLKANEEFTFTKLSGIYHSESLKNSKENFENAVNKGYDNLKSENKTLSTEENNDSGKNFKLILIIAGVFIGFIVILLLVNSMSKPKTSPQPTPSAPVVIQDDEDYESGEEEEEEVRHVKPTYEVNQKTYDLKPIYTEEELDKFDIFKDRPCQNFIGSRSTYDNLNLIDNKSSVFTGKLKIQDKETLFRDLDNVLSRKHLDKIWEMLWSRWCEYEKLCNL